MNIKKIVYLFWVSLFVFLWSYVSASNSGENLESLSELENLLEEEKQNSLDKLQSYNEDLKKSLNLFEENVLSWENYKIISSLDKFDLQLKDKVQNRYFDIKTNIINDFSSLKTDIILLEEKQSMNLLSEEELNSDIISIKSDMDSFYTKYEEIVNEYKENYSQKIDSKKDEYLDLLEDSKSEIEDIKEKKQKAFVLKERYEKFQKLISRINNLYLINSDNLYDYIVEVKKITKNNLEKSFEQKIDYYMWKYRNLKHYSWDIKNFKNSLLDEYDKKLEEYFFSLTEWFYKEQEFEFIKNNYKSFENQYFLETWVNYSSINSWDFSQWYYKLLRKVQKINKRIEDKLSELNSPESVGEVKETLNKKMEDFYDKKKPKFLEKMEDFMKKQIELLLYKAEKDLEKYNFLQSKKSDIEKFSGSIEEKYDLYKSFALNLSWSMDSIVSSDLKRKLKKDYWLSLKKMDTLKIKELKGSYSYEYKNINQKIQYIFENIQKSYINKWEKKKFIKKLENVRQKIKNYLESDKISQKSRFLLLSIRKNLIDFLYLK